MALLLAHGMKIIVQDGLDYRKATVAGLSFWLGVGFQGGHIFSDALGDGFLAALLGNGLTAGTMAAVGMTLFMELTGPRRRRLSAHLDESAIPKLDAFLRGFASERGWDEAATERLALVGEETLLSLLSDDAGGQNEGAAAYRNRARGWTRRGDRVRVGGGGRES